MANKKSSNKGGKNTMPITDAIDFRDSLSKDIDFNKPDKDLTPMESMVKELYLGLDQAIEKGMGTDKKKDLDRLKKKMDDITIFEKKLNKLVELGREIEKHFLVQNAYLINHFDKNDENRYFVVTRKMTSDLVNQNSGVPNGERVELAKKILDFIKAYGHKMVAEVEAKQEIIAALLDAYNKNLSEADFDFYGKEINEDDSNGTLKSKFEIWFKLSKKLHENRKKGIEALQEDLDIDELLPKYIIQNEGDVSKKFSVMEINTKGDRMLRLVNEANASNKEIQDEKNKLSEGL
jgi:hypothetical protein